MEFPGKRRVDRRSRSSTSWLSCWGLWLLCAGFSTVHSLAPIPSGKPPNWTWEAVSKTVSKVLS